MKNYEKLICIRCHKVIFEGDINEIKKTWGKDKYLNCGYCSETYPNPYYEE